MKAAKKKKQGKPPDTVKHSSGMFSKEEYKYLSLIFFAGLLLRFIYVIETQNTPFFQNLFSDSKIYFDLAINIASGNWMGNEVFFMSPGYPYFLAVIFAVFGKSILIVRFIQIVINSVNIILIYQVAKNIHSQKAGYVAAALAAVFSSFIFYSGAILLEVIQVFILTLLLVILSDERLKVNSKMWLWAGLLLGIASYFRANILLLFPVLLVWFFIKVFKAQQKKILYRSLIYFSLGTLLPVLLVTIRNYYVGNEFVPISSNGGINFYLGNNKDATGIYKTPEDFDFFSDLSGRKYAEKLTGKNLSSSEVSTFWLQKSIDFIEHEPIKWVELTGKKILFFFSNKEIPQSAVMDPAFFADNYSMILKLPLPGFFIIFLVSIFGFTLTWKKRKKYSLIYIFLFTYLVATILFFIIGRFRVAVSPVFIVFAGVGIMEVYNVLKSKNYKPLVLPIAIMLLFVLSSNFIIPKYNFTNYDAFVNLGNSLFEKQDYDEALADYHKALSLKADANIYVLLGNTYAAKHQFKQALDFYYKAINKNPDYKLAYFNLGIAYVQTRRLPEAEDAFIKTINLDSTFGEAYRNLAIIDYIKEDYESSLEYFKKYMTLTKDEKTRQTVSKDIEELKRRLQKKNDLNTK
jgi:4-amino-4-deoxy-L-arabinose transferase-like glycosyltransferase